MTVSFQNTQQANASEPKKKKREKKTIGTSYTSYSSLGLMKTEELILMSLINL